MKLCMLVLLSGLTLGEAYKIEPAADLVTDAEVRETEREIEAIKRTPIEAVTQIIFVEREYHDKLKYVPREKLAEGAIELETTVRRLRRFKFVPRPALRPVAATYPILAEPRKLLARMEEFLRDVLRAINKTP